MLLGRQKAAIPTSWHAIDTIRKGESQWESLSTPFAVQPSPGAVLSRKGSPNWQFRKRQARLSWATKQPQSNPTAGPQRSDISLQGLALLISSSVSLLHAEEDAAGEREVLRSTSLPESSPHNTNCTVWQTGLAEAREACETRARLQRFEQHHLC